MNKKSLLIRDIYYQLPKKLKVTMIPQQLKAKACNILFRIYFTIILCVLGISHSWAKADVQVQGKVISSRNCEGLASCEIQVKSSLTGTVADANGNFRLALRADRYANQTSVVLVLSYMGYIKKEVVIPLKANNPKHILTLRPERVLLKELYSMPNTDGKAKPQGKLVKKIIKGTVKSAKDCMPTKLLQGTFIAVNTHKEISFATDASGNFSFSYKCKNNDWDFGNLYFRNEQGGLDTIPVNQANAKDLNIVVSSESIDEEIEGKPSDNTPTKRPAHYYGPPKEEDAVIFRIVTAQAKPKEDWKIFYTTLQKKLWKNNYAKKVEGLLLVNFDIEKDGKITGTHIVKGVNKEVDLFVKKILPSVSTWLPGKQRGIPVKTSFTLPIWFVN